MKQFALAVAVLVQPLAAQALSVERPGPHTMPKPQVACQNLLDKTDLQGHEILKKAEVYRNKLARHMDPAMEAKRMLCMTIPKGAKVTVRDRWIALECLDITGRPSTGCFWTENVSGWKREDKSPYPWSSYY